MQHFDSFFCCMLSQRSLITWLSCSITHTHTHAAFIMYFNKCTARWPVFTANRLLLNNIFIWCSPVICPSLLISHPLYRQFRVSFRLFTPHITIFNIHIVAEFPSVMNAKHLWIKVKTISKTLDATCQLTVIHINILFFFSLSSYCVVLFRKWFTALLDRSVLCTDSLIFWMWYACLVCNQRSFIPYFSF